MEIIKELNNLRVVESLGLYYVQESKNNFWINLRDWRRKQLVYNNASEAIIKMEELSNGK